MSIQIQDVNSKNFLRYGKVLTGYDVTELLSVLNKITDKPADSVIYIPGEKELEKLPITKELSENAYGGMPIQVGYCNGNNTKLNCLEHHRGSEVNIPANDIIFLLAPLQEVENNQISSDKVEAFRVPAGTVCQLYETTLHYAPCNNINEGKLSDGFRVACALPKDTNIETPKPSSIKNNEDAQLWAKNKWLLAHPDTEEAKQGAVKGILGPNIDLKDLIK